MPASLKTPAFTLEKLDARDGRGESDLGWGVAKVIEVADVLSPSGVVTGQAVRLRVRCKSCKAEAALVSKRGTFIGQFRHVDGCPVLREVAGVSGEVVQ